MPKFCANLTMLYNEHGFLDRFAAAREDGFAGVEYMFPYAFRKEDLAEALERNGLVQVLHNLPAGDWEGGERGIACLPDRVGEFQEGVGRGLEYARALGCPQLNCLVGLTPSGADAQRVHQTLVANLRFAADELGRAGIRLLVEPVNSKDIPGFHLDRVDKAVAVLDDVRSPNAFLQFDFYHQQRMDGELLATYRRLKDRMRTSRSRTIPAATNPARARSTTPSCSRPSIARATRAGSAVSTSQKPRPRPDLAGLSTT